MLSRMRTVVHAWSHDYHSHFCMLPLIHDYCYSYAGESCECHQLLHLLSKVSKATYYSVTWFQPFDKELHIK